MGVFSRISDIINSNINAILDRAQDPEKIIRLIIQEMEDTLVEVRSAAVRTIAEQKELDRKIATVARDVEEWQTKAEFALVKGREDLAKGALQVKSKLQHELDGLKTRHEQIEAGLVKQGEDVAALQQKLADAKAREATMIARHKTATNRLKLRSSTYDGRVGDAFARFEQIERALDELEGKVDIYDMAKPKGVAEELAELQADHQVERELAALKAKLAGTGETR
ncbi:phage shock protein PspA [Telmatospirillum siberiense]|uniref:Phage shock protein PspA n=1 Tax=Telmatospirillum siberiense TaxID=382514 RepID=A0A2N3PYU4_9PROT|nr:phage shock protein PspA [Telmatospirillum siberiense]PKU25570.1 phage shock protein PspA [Telmatospirillum siberiense]